MNTKITKDGWHTLNGYEVYVEDNRVKIANSKDGQRTLYPYIACKNGGWDNASGVFTLSELRGRLNRGTAKFA